MTSARPLSLALVLIAVIIIGFGFFGRPPLDAPLFWGGFALLVIALATYQRRKSASSDGGYAGDGGSGDWGDCDGGGGDGGGGGD